MKKIYTLLVVAFLSSGALLGQTTEDFNNFEGTTTYSDGSFVGNGGIVYTYGHSRNSGAGTADDYSVDGNGLMLRRASDSYIEASFPDGLSGFSFQYRKAFTSGTVRQLEVLVNGNVNYTLSQFGEDSGISYTTYNFTVSFNQPGPVVIRIKNVGNTTSNRQTTIDNIIWTPLSLSVKQNNISALEIYPNPVTNGTFYINTRSNSAKDVVVFDILGKQVMKTSSTKSVNVSNLNTGVYIVKITEDGKTATRKLIIK